MADKNIGGIRATLGLDAQGWAKGLSDSMRSLNYWEKSVGSKLDQFRKKVAGRMAGIGQSMAGFGLGLTAGMGAAVKVFADFDKSAQKVNSIMRLSGREADAFRLQIRTLTRDLGLNVDATQAMDAAYAVASSGFTDAAEQSQVLTAGLRLAVAGQADSRVTMDALTGALRAYGKGAADAADFADILATTVEVGQTEVADLAQTLSRVTTTAANAGVSFDQVGSAIAAMTVKGAPTANVMDALNQAMIQMQAPSSEARKALAAVGLEADTLGKTLRDKGLRQALVQVFQATGGRMDLLKPILGDVNAVKAAQMLGAGGGADMAAAEEQMAQRAGKAQAQAAEISKSFSEQVGILGNALKDLGISLAEGLMPTLRGLTEHLKSLTDWIGRLPEPLKAAIGQFAGLAAVAALALGVLLQLAPGIVSITGFIMTGGLSAALTAAAGGFATLASALAPVAAILAGVAAVVALLATAWTQNWGHIREATASFVTQARAILGGLMSEIEADIMPILRELQAAFLAVWNDPAVQEAMRFMSAAFSATLRMVVRDAVVLLRALAEAFSVGWAALKVPVVTAMALLLPLVQAGMDAVHGVVQAISRLMRGDWSGAWDAMVRTVKGIGAALKAAVSGALQQGLDAVLEFVDRFYRAGELIAQAMAAGMRGNVSDIVNSARALRREAIGQAATVTSAGNAAAAREGWAGVQQWGADLWSSIRNPRKPAPAAPPPPGPAPSDGSGSGSGSKRVATQRQLSEAERVVGEINRRVGGFFEPGNPEQCANFVRDVYRSAGVKLGVTGKPLDRGPVGAGLASSFAGTDVGQIITQLSDLKPGDIVTYRNTYGNFEPGAITHAGVYAGGGQVVHRPTRSGQVVRADVSDPGQFAYGVRPYAMAGPDASEGAFQRMAQWREQVRGLTSEQKTLADKLAEVDERFAAMAREGLASGASQADLAQVERARQNERGRLLSEQAERERALLAEMSTERLSLMSDDTERERAELLARFEAIVDHWQKVAIETPALAAQVEEHIAAVRQAYREQRAKFEQEAEAKRLQTEQQAWEKRYNQDLQQHEFRVQMGQETQQQMLAFLEQELLAWQGTDAEKRALMLRYQEAYRADLQARREAREEWDVADLERELAYLTAKTDLTVAEEVRRDALLAEVHSAQMNRLSELRQRAQEVADAMRNSFQQAFVSILSGQQTVGQGIKSVWDAVKQAFLQAIAEMIIKTQAFQAALMALKAIMSSIGGFFGGLFGFHGGGLVGAPMVAPDLPVVAHTGGLLGYDGALQTFHAGGSVGRVSLRPDEVLAKLQTGEIVLSRDNVRDLGRLGAGSSAGPAEVHLTIQNLHQHGPQDVRAMARDLGRHVAFYAAGG